MEPKESNSSKHFKISVVKSILRMFGCTAGMIGSVFTMASFFFVAEILGIMEEM